MSRWKLGSMVRINGLFHLLINGIYWGYNPLSNLLVTSWDIQVGIQSYSQMMIGMSNHFLSIAFRFHYHSQKVIGSLGIYIHPWSLTVRPWKMMVGRRLSFWEVIFSRAMLNFRWVILMHRRRYIVQIDFCLYMHIHTDPFKKQTDATVDATTQSNQPISLQKRLL